MKIFKLMRKVSKIVPRFNYNVLKNFYQTLSADQKENFSAMLKGIIKNKDQFLPN